MGAHSAPKFITVANPKSNRAAVSLAGVGLQSLSAFSIDARRTTCKPGGAIAAGKSCKVAVVFAPIVSGPVSDILMVTGNMSNGGPIVALFGTGGR
jgi:hypothetical protein